MAKLVRAKVPAKRGKSEKEGYGQRKRERERTKTMQRRMQESFSWRTAGSLEGETGKDGQEQQQSAHGIVVGFSSAFH